MNMSTEERFFVKWKVLVKWWFDATAGVKVLKITDLCYKQMSAKAAQAALTSLHRICDSLVVLGEIVTNNSQTQLLRFCNLNLLI